MLSRLEASLDLCPEIRAQLESALAEDCPLATKDGGIIRGGYNGELDRLRDLAVGGKEWIARYQAGQAAATGIPNLKVAVEFYEGKPISVELPATVDMTVVETEPGLKGATVSNVTKPAKMETGLVVQVPPFITEGEKIRVNTAEGTYQERA